MMLCIPEKRTISQWTIYWFLACLLLSLLAVPQHRKWDPLIISNKCCLFIATDHIRPSSVSLRLAEETWTTRPCAPARVSNFLRNRWINRRAAETPSNGKINKHPSRNRWSMNLAILELSWGDFAEGEDGDASRVLLCDSDCSCLLLWGQPGGYRCGPVFE